MSKLKTLGLAGTAAIALLASGANAQTAQGEGGRIKPVIDSSVRVLAMLPDGTTNMGTGWVIEPANQANRAGAAIVITARHLVAGAVRVTVVEPGSPINDQRAAVVHSSTPERDLAFLEVKDVSEPALTITRNVPNVGDTVRGIGFSAVSDENEATGRATRASPKLGGLSKVFRGIIGQGATAPIDQIEFDAPILGGFSGGPLVNDCGQVIGVMVKDGGHIVLPTGRQIAMAQGVSVAVASNEIITAAHDAGVNLTVTDGVCDARNQPPPPPPPKCSQPFITSENGHACATKTPTAIETTIHNLGGPTRLIIIVLILALALILGTIVAILRRRPAPVQPLPPPPYPEPSRPIDDISGPIVSLEHHGSSVSAGAPSGIRLTGRVPTGDVIDLRFTAHELAGPGVVLGVEGDDRAKIPDRRAKTFVSRRHACLRFDGRTFTVIDLKSANKTKIDGEVLTPEVPRSLVSGDRLELADVVLNVTID